LNPEDSRIAGLSSADILVKAAEYEEDQGGSDERDYNVIKLVRDYEKYIELRDRPDDWSEKKAQLGIVGASVNPNMEPLGKRGGGSWGSKRMENEKSMFNEADWADWQPPTKQQIMDDFCTSFSSGVGDVQDMIESFEGKKGDEEYEEIMWYKKMYGDLLTMCNGDFLEEDEEKPRKLVSDLKSKLEIASNSLVDKVEQEDRSMKYVSKLMAELEEEIERYASNRDTKKYTNIQARLIKITKEMKVLQPTSQANIALKIKYNERLTDLWKDFEDRSDSLVEELEKQMGDKSEDGNVMTNSQRHLASRKDAIERYKSNLVAHVRTCLQGYKPKFTDDREIEAFADWVVSTKMLDQEVNQFIKKGLPWVNFNLTEKTKQQVVAYLKGKMERYKKGEVFKRINV